jgi:hypothetical protein
VIEFETFCFLQNHKTGCSFVESFLRQHCSEDLVRYEKHRALAERCPGKFHFTGVREPLDAYLSLFNYGLDGKGEIFARLGAAGAGDHYAAGIEGFADWLELLLDPQRAASLYPPGCAVVAARCGLLTARFLRLAIPGWEHDPAGDWRERLAGPGAVDAVLRYENLVEQMQALVGGPLRHAFADPERARAWLAAGPRVNASQRRDRGHPPRVPAGLRARLVARERLLYDAFYPAARPDALEGT